MLEATATPVGLLEEAAFEVAQEQLEPGSKVVIYTDGVTEAQNAEAEFFGRQRLRDVLEASASADCATIHDAVQQAVAAFTAGTPQGDDITVMVLEYAG